MGFIVSVSGLIEFVREGSLIAFVVFLAVLPILYPILRTILRKIVSSESAKLHQVMDELARLTEG